MERENEAPAERVSRASQTSTVLGDLRQSDENSGQEVNVQKYSSLCLSCQDSLGRSLVPPL